MSERSDVAGWAWVLAGLFLGAGVERTLASRPPAVEALDALRQRPVDLTRSSALELRRLPGIGTRRAAEIVRARRLHDPERGALHLDDLPGIGPVTVRGVREVLPRREPPAEVLVEADPRLWLVGPPNAEAPGDSDSGSMGLP